MGGARAIYKKGEKEEGAHARRWGLRGEDGTIVLNV